MRVIAFLVQAVFAIVVLAFVALLVYVWNHPNKNPRPGQHSYMVLLPRGVP